MRAIEVPLESIGSQSLQRKEALPKEPPFDAIFHAEWFWRRQWRIECYT